MREQYAKRQQGQLTQAIIASEQERQQQLQQQEVQLQATSNDIVLVG